MPGAAQQRELRWGGGRPLVLTLLFSLLLHGGALAAFLGWNEGPRVEVGDAILVEVVALSTSGAAGGAEVSAHKASEQGQAGNPASASRARWPSPIS